MNLLSYLRIKYAAAKWNTDIVPENSILGRELQKKQDENPDINYDLFGSSYFNNVPQDNAVKKNYNSIASRSYNSMLNDVNRVFGSLKSTATNDDLRDAARRMYALMQDHSTRFRQVNQRMRTAENARQLALGNVAPEARRYARNLPINTEYEGKLIEQTMPDGTRRTFREAGTYDHKRGIINVDKSSADSLATIIPHELYHANDAAREADSSEDVRWNAYRTGKTAKEYTQDESEAYSNGRYGKVVPGQTPAHATYETEAIAAKGGAQAMNAAATYANPKDRRIINAHNNYERDRALNTYGHRLGMDNVVQHPGVNRPAGDVNRATNNVAMQNNIRSTHILGAQPFDQEYNREQGKVNIVDALASNNGSLVQLSPAQLNTLKKYLRDQKRARKAAKQGPTGIQDANGKLVAGHY